MAWRHNLLYAPSFPSSEPDLDALGVVVGEYLDTGHLAQCRRYLPAPLILLLRDAHLGTWSGILSSDASRSCGAAGPCGRGNDAMNSRPLVPAERDRWSRMPIQTRPKKHALSRARRSRSTCTPYPLSCTPSLAYTVCRKAGSINTDTRALRAAVLAVRSHGHDHPHRLLES